MRYANLLLALGLCACKPQAASSTNGFKESSTGTAAVATPCDDDAAPASAPALALDDPQPTSASSFVTLWNDGNANFNAYLAAAGEQADREFSTALSQCVSRLLAPAQAQLCRPIVGDEQRRIANEMLSDTGLRTQIADGIAQALTGSQPLPQGLPEGFYQRMNPVLAMTLSRLGQGQLSGRLELMRCVANAAIAVVQRAYVPWALRVMETNRLSSVAPPAQGASGAVSAEDCAGNAAGGNLGRDCTFEVTANCPYGGIYPFRSRTGETVTRTVQGTCVSALRGAVCQASARIELTCGQNRYAATVSSSRRGAVAVECPGQEPALMGAEWSCATAP